MAITITFVPAGQATPPGFQSLARIRCRRQLPSWEHLTHRENNAFYLPLPVLGEDDFDELWLVEKNAETDQQQRYQNGVKTESKRLSLVITASIIYGSNHKHNQAQAIPPHSKR